MTRPFSKYFDHTLLKAEASPDDIIQLCRDAVKYDFASVCVNSRYVTLAVRTLRDLQEQQAPGMQFSPVVVTSVVGFPLGAMARAAKVFEAETALKAGAHDIDMVISVGAVKAGNYPAVTHEVAEVKEVVEKHGGTLKVILETCLLTEPEISLAAKAACEGGADFLKTSTGFGPGGATVKDLTLMKEAAEGWAAQKAAASEADTRSTAPAVPQLKASGGIRDLKTAKEMIAAGADRLGTSATIAIMKEYYEAGIDQ